MPEGAWGFMPIPIMGKAEGWGFGAFRYFSGSFLNASRQRGLQK